MTISVYVLFENLIKLDTPNHLMQLDRFLKVTNKVTSQFSQ